MTQASEARAPEGDRPSAPARPGLLARLGGDDAASVLRRYTLSGALWSLVAALLGGLGLAQLAFAIDPPFAALGVGRLDAASRQVLLLGSISLPLAGGLLAAGGLSTASEAIIGRARGAILLWNLGLLLGLAGILVGLLDAQMWAALPAPAAGLICLAALLWTSALVACAGRSGPGPSLPVAAGLLAALGLLVHLGLGSLLAASLQGAAQALAAASLMRGLPDLWLVPASLGLLAALLPAALGRPLFGRRLALLGLWSWTLTASLALPRDLLPDLLPAWLQRPVEAAALLSLAPAVALAALLLGTWIPDDRESEAVDDPASQPATSAPTSQAVEASAASAAWRRLLLAAAALLSASLILGASLLPETRRILIFSTWSPAAAILPPPGPTWLVSICAIWAMAAATRKSDARLRWLARLSLAAVLLGHLPLAPLALAETARASGAAGEMLRLEAWLRLPGHLAFVLAALLACWLVRPAGNAVAGGAAETPGPWSSGWLFMGRPGIWLAGGAALIGACLFVTSLLPLADAVLSRASTRGTSDAFAPGGLAAEGRARYIAEGCVGCHSQRVLDAADPAFGPPTGLRAQAGGPAPIGHRRAGEDLAWAGERYGDAELIRERLAVHAAGGSPAYPWLFERAGPLPAGEAVVQYLAALRGRAQADVEAGP